jgi:hypothetical protein
MGQTLLHQLHNLKLLDVMLLCNPVERLPNILYFLTKETIETACVKHSVAVLYHGRTICCNAHVQVPSIKTYRDNEHCFVVIVGVPSVNRMKHTIALCGGKMQSFVVLNNMVYIITDVLRKIN